ncbi:hypothetical protein [Parablautia muri]|uniref:hypothetical protein n=1 Tax=Parablautia muri TaxID=2320879 RepID=UPI00136EA300|nr:hypothetical protein [Parablautia muri]
MVTIIGSDILKNRNGERIEAVTRCEMAFIKKKRTIECVSRFKRREKERMVNVNEVQKT